MNFKKKKTKSLQHGKKTFGTMKLDKRGIKKIWPSQLEIA
jgi:hypothetical protein